MFSVRGTVFFNRVQTQYGPRNLHTPIRSSLGQIS